MTDRPIDGTLLFTGIFNAGDTLYLSRIQVDVTDPTVHVTRRMAGTRGATFPYDKFFRSIERESAHEIIKS